MTSNVQRLGEALASRMKKTANAAIPTALELGTIGSNMSLTTDSIKTPIPPNQYMVSLSLTHETYFTYNELNSSAAAPHHHEGGTHPQKGGSGYHTHDDGLHDHAIPSVFRRLKPGDRVLVAWCGVEPVIISIVVSGDTITPN